MVIIIIVKLIMNKGKCYYGGYECFAAMVDEYGIDFCMAFCKCNAFKYRWRAGKKTCNPSEDLKKARHYELLYKAMLRNYPKNIFKKE